MSVPPYPSKIDRKLVGLKAHAFVADADTYFGKVMCNLLLAQNYTITATLRDPTGSIPPYVHQVVTQDTESLRPALLSCDLIVYQLIDATEAATRAIRYLMGSRYEVEKTFVLISSVLTWAATTPVADLPVDPLDGEPAGEPPVDEVSEQMYQRRAPHPAYAAWKETEKLCRRANSETLHTHVLFSGLQYGEGEGALLPLFKHGWHTLPSGLPLLGNGRNIVPTIHVRDLANYVLSLAQRTGGPDDHPRYTFAVDHGTAPWGAVVQKLSDTISNGVVTPVDTDDACMYANTALFLLNLVVAEDSRDIDAALQGRWHAPNGLVAHADLAVSEFKHAHNVAPVRVCILGPPASGKSYYAARLAARYNLRHLTTPLVIAEFAAQEAELAAQVAARKAAVVAKRAAAAAAARGRAGGASDGDREGAEDDEDDDDDDGVDGYRGGGGGGAADLDADFDDDQSAESAAIEALEQRLSDVRRVLSMKVSAPAPSTDDRRRKRPTGSAGRQRTRLAPAQLQVQSVADAAAAEARAASGRYTSRCIALMWRWFLHQPDVRNRGYIMDGFPRTVAEARLVFERMSPAELAPPDDVDGGVGGGGVGAAGAGAADDDLGNLPPRPADDALLPECAIVLHADDLFLAERAASLPPPPIGHAHDTPAEFQRRLSRWRERALTPRGLLVYLDSTAAVPGSADPDASAPATHPSEPTLREVVQRAFAVDSVPITIAAADDDATAAAAAAGAGAAGSNASAESSAADASAAALSPSQTLLAEMMAFIGPPRRFGLHPEELADEKQAIAARAAARAESDATERAKAATADAAVFEAIAERRAVDDALMGEVAAQEAAALALRKAPLKDYLMEHVVSALAKGLVEVCERRPEDPIDYLGPWHACG